MATRPSTPAPIALRRPMPVAKNWSRRTKPITASKPKPVARCTTTGMSPAARDASPISVNAMPKATPLPTPSSAPWRTLPTPPGVYDVSTNATTPSAIPADATPLGRTPLITSHTIGTAASSTDESGATMPMRATEYPRYSSISPVIIDRPDSAPMTTSRPIHCESTSNSSMGDSNVLTATAVRVTVNAGVVRAERAAKKSDAPSSSAAAIANARAALTGGVATTATQRAQPPARRSRPRCCVRRS